MRTARRGRKWNYLIAVVISAVVIVAVLATVLTAQYWWPRKPLATEYFTLGLTTSIGQYVPNTNNKTITLKILGLTLTPRLGDASNVYIDVSSHTSDDGSNWADNITKGTTKDFPITLENYIVRIDTAPDGSAGFPVEIQFGSVECQYQEMTVYVKPQDILVMGAA